MPPQNNGIIPTMKTTEKKITFSTYILQAVLCFFLAFLCFHRELALWNFIYLILLCSTGFLFLNQLVQMITQHKSLFTLTSTLKLIVFFGFFLYALFHPHQTALFVPWIIGWYALLIASVQAINYYVYRRDSLRGTFWRFVLFLVSLVFGLILVFGHQERLHFLSVISGVWLVFYGISCFIEALRQIVCETAQRKLRKHTCISSSILLSALVPIRAFSSISGLGKSEKLSEKMQEDVEVFIYLKGSGPESLGHVDVAFKDKIYSYGLHDPKHRKLNGTLGDGVLIVADRTSFLAEHLQTEHKLIISYGIALNDSQKKILQARIDELMSRTVLWQCAYQEGNTQAHDYASRVAKETNCLMYKFTHRKFRTYFVLSTNCVLLADHLLRCDELDLFDFNGIVTPGSYLTFLNTEYLRNHTLVTSRHIYDKNSL